MATEKDLSDALLNLDVNNQSAPPDPRKMTWKILEHDKRRVRRQIFVAVAFWLMAAFVALAVAVMGGLVMPALAQQLHVQEGIQLDDAKTPIFTLAKFVTIHTVLGTVSFILLVLAGLFTVRLLWLSRQATLRQLNANLAAISEQLKQLTNSAGRTATTQQNDKT